MSKNQPLDQFHKTLLYMLGRRPDEFGIIPDDNGFVKIKHILQALNDEEGFRHIRAGNFKELFISHPDCQLEKKEDMIRAIDRSNLIEKQYVSNPPKLLYTCITSKSYASVIENGVYPQGGLSVIILSDSKDMAMRIGKRRDPNPILLTVYPNKMQARKTNLFQLGDHIYISDWLPEDCFSGPPLPKEKKSSTSPKKEAPIKEKHYGSFMMGPQDMMDEKKPYQQKHAKKSGDWKREVRKFRKSKR